jgi:hypothetical protein
MCKPTEIVDILSYQAEVLNFFGRKEKSDFFQHGDFPNQLPFNLERVFKPRIHQQPHNHTPNAKIPDAPRNQMLPVHVGIALRKQHAVRPIETGA